MSKQQAIKQKQVEGEEKAKNQNESDQNSQEQGKDGKKMSKAQKKKARLLRKKQEEKKNITQKTQIKLQQESTKQEQTQGEKQIEQKQQDKKQGKKQETEGKGKKKKPMNAAAKLALQKQQKIRKQEEQIQRQRKEFQMQQQRIRLIQQEEQRRKKAEADAIIKAIRDQKERQKEANIYGSKKQKEKRERALYQMEHGSAVVEQEQNEKSQEHMKRVKKLQDHAGLNDDRDYFKFSECIYRSPVCCILGHVDTGKTTLLDKIRHTNVQEGQAGGITQQIGATFFPQNKLIQEVNKCSSFRKNEVHLPGLLIIDTPGHQSFSNLRSRGSSLCDIAILVIDLMHGLQNQTLQSLELLKKGKTPFVVALNKIDRCYGWTAINDTPSYLALERQKPETINDFDNKLKKIIIELNEKGYNAALYWKNEDPQDFISLIPTSGITGEGLPDLLNLIVEYSLSQPKILSKVKVNKQKFSCTVMEVKMIEGHGTTIDCILVDGKIKKGDQIVLLGFDGAIVTKVKALLTPHPMKQMRLKDSYLFHSVIYGANGLKIVATDNLEKAVAGTPLIVANTPDQIEDAIVICENQLQNLKKKIELKELGVGVSASTLGSLEALIEYLNKEKIPVSHVSVGPVSKDHVIRAMKSMLSEAPEKRKKQYSCLLVFDVKVLPDAQKYAEENGIKIFSANIIYHLTGFFNKYVAEVRQQRRQKQGKEAVFPCMLKQVQTFRKSGPIVLGVDVQYGVLKIGTPICVFRQKEKGDKQIRLGVVQTIEHNHKKIKQARKATGSVAIALAGDNKIESGKNFDEKDKLVSILTRRSIDCLKQHFLDQVLNQQWLLAKELKKYFRIA